MKILSLGLSLVLTLAGGGPTCAAECEVMLPKKPKNEFPNGLPLQISTERRNGEILIKATNTARELIALTKHPKSWSIQYFLPDGIKGDSGGNAIPVAIYSLDHVVLIPFDETRPPGATQVVFKISDTHKNSTKCRINMDMGALFPSSNGYVMFSIRANLNLTTKKG